MSVVDANNAPTPPFTGPVTIALGANPGSATLGGTTTVSAIGGVATFSNLTVNRSGTGYRLVASAAGLTSATSSAFDIIAGPARRLEFGSYPLTGGTALVGIDSITVLARDAAGNLATTLPGSVVLGLFSAPFGAALQGVAAISAVAGVATFRFMRLDVAGRINYKRSRAGSPLWSVRNSRSASPPRRPRG